MKRKIISLSVIFCGAAVAVFILVGYIPGAKADTSNFSANAPSACAIGFNWTETGNSLNYDYYQYKAWIGRASQGSLINWATLDKSNITLSGTGRSFLITNAAYGDKGPKPNTSYYVMLQGCLNVGGCTPISSKSEPYPVRTSDIASPPAPPTSLSTLGWPGDLPNIAWQPSATPSYSGFRIYRSDTDTNASSFTNVDTKSSDDFLSQKSQWQDNSLSGTSIATSSPHFYEIQTYETDQYCQPVDNTTSQSANWVKFNSTLSTILTVPQTPNKVGPNSITQTSGQFNVVFGWQNVLNNTGYNFDIASDKNFTNIVNSQSYSQNTNSTQSFTLSPNQIFYYRIKALNSSAGNSSFSDYAAGVIQTGLVAPVNPVAAILSADPTAKKVTVNLAWSDTAQYQRQIDIYRGTDGANFSLVATLSPSSCIGGSCIYPTSYVDNNKGAKLDIGPTYYYKVSFVYTDPIIIGSGNTVEVPSSVFSIDSNVTPLTNYAWSGQAANGGTDPGIGWISFSAANETGATAPYGVFMNTSTGVLSGYAWTEWNGWLSFNPGDLTGCHSGNCNAQVNLSTGQVSGWAKFIGADSTQGAWDGWVSLSGSNGLPPGNARAVSWGVTYDPSTGKFSGEGWGGDVAGWISWCDSAPFASGANRYCVTTGAGTLPSANAPTIISTSSTANSITVTWTNPISYSQIQIEQTNAPNMSAQQIQDKGNYIVVRTFNSSNPSDAAYTKAISSISYTIPNLNASSTYGIFVRGTP